MVSDSVKFHLFFFAVFAFLSGLILMFVYLSVTTLQMGFEEVGLQDPDIFGYAFMSVGWGITAVIISYVLIQFVKGYLDERTFMVPEVCPECKEGIYSSTVKWIKKNRVQCPECGLEIEVSKGWDV